MSEQNHLELGRVILDFPIQAYTIKSLHVHEEANAHVSLSLLFVARGPVSEQDCIRYADSPIRIWDDQGNPIFCGTCSLISTHNLNQYCDCLLYTSRILVTLSAINFGDYVIWLKVKD